MNLVKGDSISTQYKVGEQDNSTTEQSQKRKLQG